MRTKPDDNVIVRLCDFECDFSRPINDRSVPENRAFLKDLKDWSRITKNLFVWDYTQNWYSHQGPHPNLHVLQPNIALFAKHGASGVYEQSSWESPHSDFEFLKAYILAHSLWEPNGDWREWYDEFLRHYYQEAAPYIDEYLNLIHTETYGHDVFLHMANRMEWMDYDMVVRAQHIFRRAFENISNPEVLERLKYAYLPVQYAALVCPAKVTLTDDAYEFERPQSQTFDEYWEMILDYGVTRLGDWPIEQFRERLNATTPPRYERHPITTFSSSNSKIQIVPTLGAKVTQLSQGRKQWLNGYLVPEKPVGAFQLWIADEEQTMIPVESPFTPVGESETSITVKSEIDSRWEATLQYSFAPVQNTLTCSITILNKTDSDDSPPVQLKMKLATPSRKRPVITNHAERPIPLRQQPVYSFEARTPWTIQDRNHSLGFDVESTVPTFVELKDDAGRSTTSITWTPRFDTVPPDGKVHWMLSIQL